MGEILKEALQGQVSFDNEAADEAVTALALAAVVGLCPSSSPQLPSRRDGPTPCYLLPRDKAPVRQT